MTDSGLETGDSFTLAVTVSNVGDGASAGTTLRYYRSTDATITTSDTAEGTDSVAGLAASGSSSHSVALTAPSTPEPGTTVRAWTRWLASRTRRTTARHR